MSGRRGGYNNKGGGGGSSGWGATANSWSAYSGGGGYGGATSGGYGANTAASGYNQAAYGGGAGVDISVMGYGAGGISGAAALAAAGGAPAKIGPGGIKIGPSGGPQTESPAKDIATQLGKKPAFKLRKAIHPKNPILLLNEMTAGKASAKYEFYDVPVRERERRAWYQGVGVEQIGDFDCVCIIAGSKYVGEGLSKNDARSAAAETAIQGEITKRCYQNATSRKTSEDYCPWGIIASLALYKMYDSWSLQGYTLAKELTTLPNENKMVKVPAGADAGNTIAGTWMDRDDPNKPALQRINEMASRSDLNLEFSMVEEVGLPNMKMFTFQLVIDGKFTYRASAKNKKQAKQDCAVDAIKDSERWYRPKVKKTREEKMAEKRAARDAARGSAEGDGGAEGESGEKGEDDMDMGE